MPTTAKTTTYRRAKRAALAAKLRQSAKPIKTATVAVSATRVRQEFASWVGKVRYGSTWILVKSHGKPAVAIVSMNDLELLRRLEDKIDIEAARKAMKESGDISLEEVKARLGI